MKISRKKNFLIAVLAVSIILVFIVVSGYLSNTQTEDDIPQTTEDDVLSTSQHNPEESITENDGLISTQDNSQGSVAKDDTLDSYLNKEQETYFVVPESTLGTLGLITASAAAFATFTTIKKKQSAHANTEF